MRFDLSGVVVFIILWNVLFMLMIWKVGFALAVGSTIVVKLLEWVLLIVGLFV